MIKWKKITKKEPKEGDMIIAELCAGFYVGKFSIEWIGGCRCIYIETADNLSYDLFLDSWYADFNLPGGE